jgi:hypothetical protein
MLLGNCREEGFLRGILESTSALSAHALTDADYSPNVGMSEVIGCQ